MTRKPASKHIIVRLDPDLHKAFRLACFERGENMTEVIRRAITAYIEEGKEMTEPKKMSGAYTREEISEATGFDRGDVFETETQVRSYFSELNMSQMFGENSIAQVDLDQMSEAVIENRWHCDFGEESYMEELFRDLRGGYQVPLAVNYFADHDQSYHLADVEEEIDAREDDVYAGYDVPQEELADLVRECLENEGPVNYDWSEYAEYHWVAARVGDDLFIIPDGGW